MYCLQWLIPVLLIPKPVNPALLHTHVMFMVLYLIGFFLERKPCTICSLVFLAAVFLICYSGGGNCLLWSSNCDTVRCENGWGWDWTTSTVVVPTLTCVFNGLFLFIIKLATEIYNTLWGLNIDWVSWYVCYLSHTITMHINFHI